MPRMLFKKVSEATQKHDKYPADSKLIDIVKDPDVDLLVALSDERSAHLMRVRLFYETLLIS